MELTLNIVWLFIALAAVVTAILHRRKAWIGTALVCVVALLFPIVSITDDLRCDVVFVEASVKRRGSDANHHWRAATAVALGIVATLDSFVVPMAVDIALTTRSIRPRRNALASVPARAPPPRAC